MTKSTLVRKWWKPNSKAHARLARLSVPKITVYQHVLKKYSKLGASTPVLSVVFGEEVHFTCWKAIMQCYFSCEAKSRVARLSHKNGRETGHSLHVRLSSIFRVRVWLRKPNVKQTWSVLNSKVLFSACKKLLIEFLEPIPKMCSGSPQDDAASH